MNIHTLYNLQEAYMNIYLPQDYLKEGKKQLYWTDKSAKDANKDPNGKNPEWEKIRIERNKRIRQSSRGKGSAAERRAIGRGLIPDTRPNMKEQVDLYDIILSHLLDEGYVDCLGSAEIILENMSDEWLEELLNEAEGSYGQTPTAKASYTALRMKRLVGRGKHGQSLNLVRRHLRRLASGPDAGHSGRQSSRPEDNTIRSKMTQRDRDIARQEKEWYDRDYEGVYYDGPNPKGPKGSLPKRKKLTRQRKTGVSA